MIPTPFFHDRTQPLTPSNRHAPVPPPADLWHTMVLGPLYHATTRAVWFADTHSYGPKLLFLYPDKAVAHAMAYLPLAPGDEYILAFFSYHLLAQLHHRLAPLPESGTTSWQQSLLTLQAVILLEPHDALVEHCPITCIPRSAYQKNWV